MNPKFNVVYHNVAHEEFAYTSFSPIAVFRNSFNLGRDEDKSHDVIKHAIKHQVL